MRRSTQGNYSFGRDDMTATGYKRLAIALAALVVLTAAAAVGLFCGRLLLEIQVALAAEQTQIIDECRGRALQSEVADAVGYMEYAIHYYPSGTKQEHGSRLDRIVERQRASAVRDIITHLRAKSGQDLGDDPQAWISQFGRK
ncbi:MAG: hypothetical protein ABGY75_07515 [Gemmataceae bacterium]